MPELPELETVLRNVCKQVEQLRLVKINVLCQKLRQPVPNLLSNQLQDRKIIRTERKGKYLLLYLDSQKTLVLHLGMTGWLILFRQLPEPYFDCLQIQLRNRLWLVFRCPRRLGLIDLLPSHKVQECPYLCKLGPDPFSPQFNATFLKQQLAKRKCSIKQLFLNQHFVAGLGNIYTNEALFQLGVSPLRQASQLSQLEQAKIIPTMRQVLTQAINLASASLREYDKLDTQADNYQEIFRHLISPGRASSTQNSAPEKAYQQIIAVYGRAGEPCRHCRTKLQRVMQQGRSSFFCPNCQT